MRNDQPIVRGDKGIRNKFEMRFIKPQESARLQVALQVALRWENMHAHQTKMNVVS